MHDGYSTLVDLACGLHASEKPRRRYHHDARRRLRRRSLNCLTAPD